MARVEHTCTGCVPIDASIIDVYVTLVETNKAVTNAEAGRVTAEGERVAAETERTATFTADHGRAVSDHSIAQQDHALAGTDHSASVAATASANAAAALANLKAELVQQRLDTADADHARAVGDHNTAVSDHSTASSDHTTAQSDHTTAGADHTRAETDHSTATSDHTASGTATAAATAAATLATEKAGLVQDKLDRADTDHTRAESDHTTAVSDHGIAGTDHTTATGDHTTASADHTLAGADHTTAASDHTTAGSDHTLAASDHTTAVADHTQALADHEVMAGYDTRLTNAETEVSQLQQEVTADISQLEAKVDNIPGPNYTAGKYLKANGVEDTNANWGITDFIEYAQGNAVEWNYGSPDQGAYVIQFYDSNKTPINNAYWGAQGTAGVRTLSASSIAQYASNGVYLRASFRLANTGAYVKVGETTAWTPQVSSAGLKQRVEALELADASLNGRISKIDNLISPSESGSVPVSINGKYIDNNGDIVDYNGYAISSPFELSAGDKIRFSLYANLVSYLCSVEDGVYTPIYYGTLADTEREYEAESAITVVLCFATNHTATYSLYKVSDLLIRESALNYNYQKEETISVGNENAYVEVSTGRVVPYTGYNISAPIHLNAGETIKATFAGQHIAVISQVVDDTYTPIVESDNSGTEKEYSYTAESSIDVALSGTAETLNADTEYTINGTTTINEVLQEIIDSSGPSFVLLNPYAGAEYNNKVCSQTHEHCYDKTRLERAYNRGIRIIACSHYKPSTPRVPLSGYNTPYQDYKSKQAVLDGDLEMVTRYTTGQIPILETASGNVNTDDIPQIANAEWAFVKGSTGQHMNILGLLWGSAGNSLCNDELTSSSEDSAMKREYSLESYTKFNELLEDESMWQFGTRYIFGTVNHEKNYGKVINTLNNCPSIFKAMELFNQGYSSGWNQEFRDAYDNVLKSGKRIWGTAAIDWQGDWATWNFTTDAEKAEWQTKYNNLSAEEQAEYGSAENYYMQTGRYKFDRGTNVLLMDDSYNSMTVTEKAKEALRAYMSGRYYMSALNTKGMKVITDNGLVVFKLSDFADKAYVITANGRTEYTGVDTINYVARADDKYIRFEAFWDNGEFVFTNPVWVEPVS